MPEPKEHSKHRGAIETVLRKIPGFRGYLEKEYRRESDALQRKWLADKLQHSKRGLDDWARQQVDAGRLDLMSLLDRVRARLDKLIARIRGAMQGYSGVFDLVSVKEDRLDAIYEHDVGLMDEVEVFHTTCEKLSNDPKEGAEALAALMKQLEALDKHADRREELLKGLE